MLYRWLSVEFVATFVCLRYLNFVQVHTLDQFRQLYVVILTVLRFESVVTVLFKIISANAIHLRGMFSASHDRDTTCL